jgi:hypothetical protein
VNTAFFRCCRPPQPSTLGAVIEEDIAMNQFTAFGIDAVAAEVAYRRSLLAVSTPRRPRRPRRAVR